MIYVTSDLHGYPLPDFLRLLDKARFSDSDDLIVLGDVIDRNGDGGVETLRWMLQQVNVRMIMGNHEAMLLSCRFLFEGDMEEILPKLDLTQKKLLSVWLRNGAEPTILTLRKLFQEDAETAEGILDYLLDAPLYETVKLSGKQYVLTHAGLGHFSPKKRLSEYAPDDLIWYRPRLDETYFQHATVVFGHTPTQYYGEEYADRMLKTSTWIDIDTGAAGGHSPMLLRLGDEQPIYAE